MSTLPRARSHGRLTTRNIGLIPCCPWPLPSSQFRILGKTTPCPSCPAARPMPTPCATATPLGWPYGLVGALPRPPAGPKMPDAFGNWPSDDVEPEATFACAAKSRASCDSSDGFDREASLEDEIPWWKDETLPWALRFKSGSFEYAWASLGSAKSPWRRRGPGLGVSCCLIRSRPRSTHSESTVPTVKTLRLFSD